MRPINPMWPWRIKEAHVGEEVWAGDWEIFLLEPWSSRGDSNLLALWLQREVRVEERGVKWGRRIMEGGILTFSPLRPASPFSPGSPEGPWKKS